MKIFWVICLLLVAGCINTDPDIRPPLMNTNDFSNFEAPEIGTNQTTNTEINVIVAP